MPKNNNRPWNGLLKIDTLEVIDAHGQVRLMMKDLRNTLHRGGEQLILQAVFIGGGETNTFIPTHYHFGLDNRAAITVEDDLSTLVDGSFEPSGGGYQRQPVASMGQFSMQDVNGTWQAAAPAVTFSSTTAAWGPVRNLFMTDATGSTGNLIASVPLVSPLTLNPSESIRLRMSLALRDCP